MAAEMEPQRAEASYIVAAIHGRRGDIRQAEEWLTRTRGLTSRPAAIDLDLARLALADNRPAEAVRLAKHVVAEYPTPDAYMVLAEAYRASGNTAAADAVLVNAQRRWPKNPAVATIAGMLKHEGGNRAAARVAYERALALNPNNGVAANNLAWLYAEAGRVHDALALAQRAERVLAGAPQALDTLVWMYHLTGSSQQGIPRVILPPQSSLRGSFTFNLTPKWAAQWSTSYDFQTSDFAALLTFLETQGAVNVLSSPRVATINNQKAVLKVGTDDFFVTNISTTTTTSGVGASITTPTITVQPFFSGIALDVTPQIDDNNNIILHVHPQVSRVVEQRKVIDLGGTTGLGTFVLPLASSSVNETDTIVRVQDGNIVAIGGLMRQDSATARSQVPGFGDIPGVGALFQQRNTRTTKSEIVILLKPTIIHSDSEWQRDLADTRERIRALRGPQPSQPQPSQP